jgi:hypothetical protein
MSKTMFDLDTLMSAAKRLKYLRGVKEKIRSELSDPSDWLVRELIRDVTSAERISGQLLEQFKPIVIDAIKGYINDRINERLSSAMEAEKPPEAPPVEETAEDESGIITTAEELEGLYIVRAICASEIDPSRLSEKDTKNYCNILLDSHNWKSILRLHFNGTQKKIEIFDDAEPKMLPIDNPSGIYQYADRVRAALKAKMG